MYVGAYFVCVGRLASPITTECIIFEEDVAVCPRPEHCPDLSWGVMHQFAGAFAGWHQAIAALSKTELPVNFGQQIEVDASSEVAQLWQEKASSQVFVCPLQPFAGWDPRDRVYIHGPVSDHNFRQIYCIHSAPRASPGHVAPADKGFR